MMKVLQSLVHRLEKAHLLDNLRPLSQYSNVFHRAIRSYQDTFNPSETQRSQPSRVEVNADCQVIPASHCSPHIKQKY
ncbi:MAG: hypothetical protein LH647_07680 [Leptolyngbyaceae cyanobacterium CAN_BIN12]|nr:hypothetical protein [Leptolyngbyaceae cyanobacterium CAN_BIN12]